METQLLPALRSQASDARESFEARARLEEHALQTACHVERLKEALKGLGSAVPAFQTGLVLVVGKARSLPGKFFADSLVRKTIADLAAEQLEVAAYTAIIAAAEQAGEHEVARLCRLNRDEDEEMAEWLDAQIPIVIAQTPGDAQRGGT